MFRSSSTCPDEIIILSLLCDLSAKSKAGRFDFSFAFFYLLILKRILEKVAVVVV